MYNTLPSMNPFLTRNTAINPSNASMGMAALQKPQLIDEASPNSFKNVMSNLISDTEKTLSLPDELMQRSLTTGDVDIHEVMIANTKADIAVNIASQVVTKIIQAYERVQQIQV